MQTQIKIDIEGASGVSGVLHTLENPLQENATAVILAHGAGNDMENPLIVAVCERLSQAGFPALRFNFLYKEAGRKAPDSQKKLMAAWKSAERFLREESGMKVERLVVGGKSMGGRVASQMVAEWLLPADGLIFLGYPLHPPGKKESLRDAHLYTIHVPMLFFAGTRDKLCDERLLRGVLARLEVAWTLELIEKGDHSFRVPKAVGISQEEIHEEIAQKAVEWVRRLWAS